MRNSFIETLTGLAAENDKIWLVCGDLGFSVLERFASRFPERYINAGVAEQNMAGVAAGLGLSGCTVFVYSIGNFPTMRCLEQIRNSICYHRADVKIVALGSGLAYGSHGYTHHAIEDLAVVTAMPGMEVFTPSDPDDVRTATRHMAGSGCPSYLRLSRAGEPKLGSEEPQSASAPRLVHAGENIVILAAGAIAATCLDAVRILEQRGLMVGLRTVPRLKPSDEDYYRAIASRASLVVTVEEHVMRGGLFAAVAAAVAGTRALAPILGIGIPEPAQKPSLAGTREELLAAVGLSA